MFDWLKLSVFRQLVGLLGCLLLSAVIGYYKEFHPLIKFNFEFVLRGVVAGVVVTVIAILFHFLLLQIAPRNHAPALLEARREMQTLSPISLIGRLLFTGVGEEFLLRGYVLGTLSYMISGWAVLVNAALSYLLYFRNRHFVTFALVRMLEGMFFGALYLQHRSLLLVGLAHATSEGLLLFLARTRQVNALLNKYQG